MGVRTQYLHSDIDTFERTAILRDLRLGVYDVVVGINLLREGLDLPEVSLVAILDADFFGQFEHRPDLGGPGANGDNHLVDPDRALVRDHCRYGPAVATAFEARHAN